MTSTPQTANFQWCSCNLGRQDGLLLPPPPPPPTPCLKYCINAASVCQQQCLRANWRPNMKGLSFVLLVLLVMLTTAEGEQRMQPFCETKTLLYKNYLHWQSHLLLLPWGQSFQLCDKYVLRKEDFIFSSGLIRFSLICHQEMIQRCSIGRVGTEDSADGSAMPKSILLDIMVVLEDIGKVQD